MTRVEPIPDARAALATVGDRRLLLIADYHAGFEAGLRADRGVHVPSRAGDRRERLTELIDRTDADRLVVLGDLTHSIGGPTDSEREEVESLLDAIAIPVTIAKGNHDGGIGDWLTDRDVAVTAAGGELIATEETADPVNSGEIPSLGVLHGHAWPDPSVLAAPIVCIGHEHPRIRLADPVGGRRTEPAWLRGRLDTEAALPDDPTKDPDTATTRPFVLVPAFNRGVGGTHVNDDDFLAPFLPDAITEAEAFLLDGTRLGDYRRVPNRGQNGDRE